LVNTKEFWIALVVSVVVYWRLPVRMRSWFLAITSFAYVAYVEWWQATDNTPVDVKLGAAALAVFAAAFYLVSQRLRGRPPALVVALICAVLAYLAYYKYFPAIYHAIVPKKGEPGAAAALAVPLGASYFTFKLVHYAIESSRTHFGPDKVERPNVSKHDWGTFLSYVFFFPTFTAGPIERFETQATPASGQPLGWMRSRVERLTRADLVEALTRVMYGLIKKFVIVDLVLGKTSVAFERPTWVDALPLYNSPLKLEQLLQDLPAISPLFVWQFLVNKFLTTYIDFSAYSDIAIGCALLFGVRVMENFDWPIFARNIGDFWKRWHISLSSWCQQYVYLPMIGRTRNPYIAVYATQLAIGVWHMGNANYLSWGAYHATLMVTYLTWGRIKRKKKWKLRGKPLEYAGILLTFLCVTVGHAFVSTSEVGMRPALRLLAKLFGIDVFVPGAA
jgi:alginate O-acetyltransferase complex protein AlgI